MKYISNKRKAWIINIYLFGILFWFFIVAALRLYTSPAAVILWLAPIVFLIGMNNASTINAEVEGEIFTTSFFGIGLIVAISILAWIKELDGVTPKSIGVLLLAMIFSLIPHIDLWLPRKWMSVYKHLRSVFQTYSVVLFTFVLVEFLFAEVKYKETSSIE